MLLGQLGHPPGPLFEGAEHGVLLGGDGLARGGAPQQEDEVAQDGGDALGEHAGVRLAGAGGAGVGHT